MELNMPLYNSLSKEELHSLLSKFQNEYNNIKDKNLKLDMSRGKPGADQLDISMEMLDCIHSSEACKANDGTDCRNYGVLDGIMEARQLFADILEVSPTEVIVGGNSSLNMMYDTIARAISFGVLGSKKPWGKLAAVKFICPSPGYDRHFAICELFGIEMITVDMKADGPDMNAVERLVDSDESIKGIWCVPKYSNPEGITYSDAVVERFAKLKPKATDFRIFWDNAYAVHHLTDKPDILKNIMTCCRENGNEDMIFIYGSTSKITFPGVGIAAMGASEANLKEIKKQIGIQTIGPDKLNQLRHTKYFGDINGIIAHMKKHACILKPKFDIVLDTLETELSSTGLAQWKKPNGGYFISLDTINGCAKRTIKLCKEAGVVMTTAGATYPYAKDPADKNIRIAPTFPPVSELKIAIDLFCLCVKIAGIEKLLAE
jgi:aspartate/methionine/tyrosine aminotransferase